VTIALVVANFAIFLFTNNIVDRQSTTIGRQLREVVSFAREHPYLRLPAELTRSGPPGRPPADLPAETLAAEQAKLDDLWKRAQESRAALVFRAYGYIPAQPHLLTLFTSMFLHAGWLHLIGNMLFLWLAGASLEDRWGRILYLILYLVSGVVATLIHAAMTPASTLPLVGASGAIAGLMGAFLIRLATTRIKLFYWFLFFRGTFQAPAYVVLPLWLLQQFLMAWQGLAGGVAVWAHIGGFVVGAAAIKLFARSDYIARRRAAVWAPRRVGWSR
jgi:membrane associated rhomboid family serine protease